MKYPRKNNDTTIILSFTHKNNQFDLQITDQRLVFIVDQYLFTIKQSEQGYLRCHLHDQQQSSTLKSLRNQILAIPCDE